MKTKAIFVLATLFLVSACKLRTPDGTLPDEYLDAAEKYTGVYEGEFGKVLDGQIEIRLEGNRPILEFTSPQSESILGEHCPSTIGQLKSIDAKEKKKKLKRAEFQLDHHCNVTGKIVTVVPDKMGNLKVYIVSRGYAANVCVDEEIMLPGYHPQWIVFGEMAVMNDVLIPDPIFRSYCEDYFYGYFKKQN